MFYFIRSLCAHRCAFLRSWCVSGYHFEVPGKLQIDKIRVRLRKAHGHQFWSHFDVLVNGIFVVFSSFFKDLRGEASSVRIAIGPFAQASNVVEEPDGYVNKLMSTGLQK